MEVRDRHLAVKPSGRAPTPEWRPPAHHGPLQRWVSRRSCRIRHASQSRTTGFRRPRHTLVLGSERLPARTILAQCAGSEAMDAEHPPSVVRSSCQQGNGRPWAVPHTAPRIALTRSASKLPRPTSLKVRPRFLKQLIELARLGIGFDLRVPSGPVALKNPVTKFREFLALELADLTLYVFSLAHVPSIPPATKRTPARRLTVKLSGRAPAPG